VTALQAARIGQAAERRRVKRIIEQFQWGASCSPGDTARVVEDVLARLLCAVGHEWGMTECLRCGQRREAA
jgi:hypothetical protein